MIWSVRLTGLMSIAGCLLLPASVPAESALADSGQRASAHLMFKIVIPQVLSVEAGQMLTVGGNRGTVFELTTASAERERRQIILTSSGHRSVAQFAACSRSEVPRGDPAMSCTVSMP